MTTHLAAVSLAKGEPFEVQVRSTPKPGPGELLVGVKSIALNPADGIMRDQGLFIPSYPAVIGFDIAGLVLEVGEDVPVDATKENRGLYFKPGITRIAAYSAFFWASCHSDYGAFQERCLVPWQHAVPLPDENISWNQAATLPVAVEVPLSAWDDMGIPRVWESQRNNRRKAEALLLWGASSSVGTMGVQTARLLREDRSSFAAVYATASVANHKYVSSLGADRVFDYKDPRVVDTIVSAARDDGLVIQHCFLAMGQLGLCQDVLKAFLGDYKGAEDHKAQIASAPVIPLGIEKVDGVKLIFVQPSANKEERLAQFQYWMGTWLRETLISGAIRPSPKPRIVGRGLGAINAGLDLLLKGVSCTKLVIEIAD